MPTYTRRIKRQSLVSFLSPMLIIGGIYMLFAQKSIHEMIYSPYKLGYWYFYVLSLYYIAIYIIRSISARLEILGVTIFYLLLIFGNTILSKELNDMFSVWMLKLYWPYFVLGYFSRKFNYLERMIQKNWVYTAAISVYIIGLVHWYYGMGWLYLFVASSFIVAIVYFFIVRKEKKTYGDCLLEFLGRNSLDIYVYHYFFVHITNLKFLGEWLETTGNVFIEILLGLVYSLIISVFAIGMGRIIRHSRLISSLVYGTYARNILPTESDKDIPSCS